MEIQLQELIDQIKKDGVETAENEAASILESAKSEAEKIVSDAKAEAEKMILDAKEQNERFARVSEESIRQAGRNVKIALRESIVRQLDTIIGDKVKEAYSKDNLSQIILKTVEAWTKDMDADTITLLLNDKDLALLEDELYAAFKEKAMTGITLKSHDGMIGGFRISADNGRTFYDYSVRAVTEMLSVYLSPKVISLMKEAE